ncbi:hypothetical protein SASPL_108533 [Salvia splendens]|uniref:Pentatricopeptide repeat domain-containing protein 1 n=1 Tax=Salvia splendens TaxID=180675 RepID=A0A8X8YEI1_SALSN|nr:hypothetical protein SASPL_108533 [Salvia splendens]
MNTTHALTLRCALPPPSSSAVTPPQSTNSKSSGKPEQAWSLYGQCTELPNSTCLSRLVSQWSYLNTADCLTRAQSIIERLRRERLLHRLDANSLGLLAVTAAKGGHTLYASSIIKSMLTSGYLPHVEAWSAVVSRLAASGDDGPAEAIKVFNSVIKRVRRFADSEIVKDSRADTGAYNAVLNSCSNLGDAKNFLQLFDEMPEFNCESDALTYNVMIKLIARAERKDLLVFVLETIIEKRIALWKGGEILRRSATYDSFDEDEESSKDDDLFEKLLPNSINYSTEPPELAEAVAPDSRMYTTLKKGYMKARRVADVVRMLEAMSHQKDSSSHPDHVTYTTVISTFMKAGAMDRARLVLVEMARSGVPANLITYNILLKGHCHRLQIDKAEDLMREMVEEAEIQPDVISYNTLIDGCILVDHCAGALSYFNEMRKRVNYTTLMKAFASSGQPKLASKVFEEMLKDPRVKVDLVAWNMLVEGYCK